MIVLLNLKWIIAKALKIFLHPPALKNCIISHHSAVCGKSELTNCTIDNYTYVGYQCFMVNTDIGKFCSIADRVSIGGAIHPMHYISTSPVFHEGNNVLHTNFSKHIYVQTPRTIIKNDVWIGQGAFIKAGTVIENGAVVGMGAVVTKNIGPYEIWAGNPARFIRKRFNEDQISQLNKSEWWNLSTVELKEIAHVFNDFDKFKEHYLKKGEGQ